MGRRKQQGENIFTDAWDGLKTAGKAVYRHVIVPANEFAKRTKIVSRALKAVPDPKAKIAGEVADNLGYGKKGRKRGGARPQGKSKKPAIVIVKTRMAGSGYNSDMIAVPRF